MAIDNKQLPASENGIAVTPEMLDEWCAAYESGSLPKGYSYDGPTRVGRPRLANEQMATMTIRIPLSQKEALAKAAKEKGMSFSGYVREVLATRSA